MLILIVFFYDGVCITDTCPRPTLRCLLHLGSSLAQVVGAQERPDLLEVEALGGIAGRLFPPCRPSPLEVEALGAPPR